MVRNRDLVPTRKEGIRPWQILGGIAIGLVVAILLRFLIQGIWIFPYAVQGRDMEPFYPAGERVYVNRVAAETPIRGAVVFMSHPHNPDYVWLRRVIGLPGDQVQIHERRVYVNNEPIRAAWEEQVQSSARYRNPPIRRGTISRDFVEPVILKPGQMFVLADNRPIALDSRQLGPVSMGLIVGAVIGSAEDGLPDD